ncbi:MAG: response regulator [Spirochaetales bacterium]|nr:response regulator [Spirochaetales bacterium]
MNGTKLDTILLVEDNDDHIEHTLDAISEAGLARRIEVVKDGEAALNYMFRTGRYENPEFSPRPSLILLDINLPKVNGFEILRRVKTHPRFYTIPVILLTSMISSSYIERGTSLGTNDIILKPVSVDIFVRKLKGLAVYWARISSLAGI